MGMERPNGPKPTAQQHGISPRDAKQSKSLISIKASAIMLDSLRLPSNKIII